MEQEKVKKQLPDSITLSDERTKMQKSWMECLGRAQRSLDELQNDPDLGEHLPPFAEITSAWIKSFIQQKIDGIMSSSYTFSQRTEAADEWRAVERDLLSKVKAIEELRSIDSDLQVTVKGSHITLPNLTELLETRNTYIVPQSFKEFYAVAVSCADQLKRLHEVQQAWGISAPPIVNSIPVQLTGQPEEFIYYCIRIQRQQEWLAKQERPSKFEPQFRQHQEQMKQLEQERQKRFNEARKEKIRKGEEVNFGTSIRTVQGDLIPVSGQKI